MPSTYTTNGGIELIATGEQSGTWGTTTNTNLQIIDRLTNGVGSITLSGTTHTLTTTDGALSEGQYKVLVFGGSPSGTNTVTISPNDQAKQYFVVNSSGESIILTQGSGTTVTIADGATDIVYADGGGASSNVVSLATDLSGVLLAANNLSDLADAGTARTNLGVAIGTNVLAYDSNLQSFVTAFTLPTVDGTSGQVLQTNGSGTISFGDKTSLATPVSVTGNATAGAEIRLPEDTDNGTNYVAIKAPDALSADRTLTLPDPAANATLGYLDIPQNSQSAAYTLVLADSGKHILHPSADTTARTFTIPANSSVAFPVGTAVTFINQNGGGDITIAITTDTLRLAGDGSTGSRTLTANGIATAVKVTSTEWIISGVNLT